MKKLIILFLFFLAFNSNAQEKKIQTLLVNNNQNVFLFFDSPIIQGIVGSSNFNFAFDLNNAAPYGIVKGKKGIISNLHIITKNGNVYTFILKYAEKLPKFNYSFFSEKDALENIKNGKIVIEKLNNKKDDSQIEVEKNNLEQKITIEDESTKDLYKQKNAREIELREKYINNKEDYIKRYSNFIKDEKPVFKRFLTVIDNVLFQLDDIRSFKDELYIKLRIINNSSIDYDVNFIKFSKIGNKISKQSTAQGIEIIPLFTYNKFSKIKKNTQAVSIYVFKKFGIAKGKILSIELNELQGERNLILPVKSRYVNNHYKHKKINFK